MAIATTVSLASFEPAAGPAEVRQDLHLTRKEAELLQILKDNAGRCLSRETLLRSVWGYPNGVRTRTLDVHILRLRKKLGPVDGSRILTVFRGGYVWAA